jgi:hypothetical protein
MPVSCPASEDPFGVLGELVHVDDVGDGAELVEGPERAPPLDPRLERDEKEDRRSDQDDVVHAGFQPLDELADLDAAVGKPELSQGHDDARHDQRDQRAGGDPEGENRALDPRGPLLRVARDVLELPGDLCEPGAWEAFFHASNEQRHRVGDASGIEAVVGHPARGYLGKTSACWYHRGNRGACRGPAFPSPYVGRDRVGGSMNDQ